MLYFAHGSFIDRPQMLVCCPEADFIAPARLNDYRLCFPRWSRVRASAVAGIELAEGESVWGVLYNLSLKDRDRLDLVEGYAPGRDPGLNASHRVTVSVERPDGMTVDAETHVPVPMDDPGVPSPGYLMVLVRAAEILQFPPEYLAMLRDVEAQRLAA